MYVLKGEKGIRCVSLVEPALEGKYHGVLVVDSRQHQWRLPLLVHRRCIRKHTEIFELQPIDFSAVFPSLSSAKTSVLVRV